MSSRQSDLPPIPDEDEALPPLPPSGEDEPLKRTPRDGASAQGASSLLLGGEAGEILVPPEDELEAPSAVLPPRAKFDENLAAVDEGEAMGFIRLDELPVEAPAADDTSTADTRMTETPAVEPSEAAPPSEDEEWSLLLIEEEPPTTAPPKRAEPEPPRVRPATAGLDEDAVPSLLLIDLETLAAAEPKPPSEAPKTPPEPSRIKPVTARLEDDLGPSSLLLDTETPAPPAPKPHVEAPPADLEPPSALGADVTGGRSSLLLDETQSTAPATRQQEPPPGRVSRWRRRRERVRIVPPKGQAQVQWFSNPDACAVYCRKHGRALLLYFTTGDVDQCRTYEEAIRRTEMQAFLCSYVCCLVNLSHAEGREVALRLGVPTDGPAMVLLSPSGREYARILKHEVDWQFLATVLFWSLH